MNTIIQKYSLTFLALAFFCVQSIHAVNEGAASSCDGKKALIQAIKNGDLKEVSTYPDTVFNTADEDGNTFIHTVTELGARSTIIAYMIEHGANFNTPNKAGESPLQVAIRLKQSSAAIALANATAGNSNLCSLELAMVYALHTQNGPLAELLLSYPRVSPKIQKKTPLSSNGNTALHIAADQGWESMVLELINSDRGSINIINKNGDTPLHLAAAKGYANIIDALNPEASDIVTKNKDNKSPLDLAIENKHVDAAITLLTRSHTSNLTVKKECFDTIIALLAASNKPSLGLSNEAFALWMSAVKGELGVIQFLIDNGVDINQPLIYGNHILSIPGVITNANMLNFLFQHGADPQTLQPTQRSPLDAAIENKNYPLVLRFLSRNNNKPSLGLSNEACALWMSAVKGNLKAVQFLIDNGVDLNQPLIYGNHILSIPAVRTNVDMLHLLLQHGANPHFSNQDGSSAIHLISQTIAENPENEENYPAILEILLTAPAPKASPWASITSTLHPLIP